MISRILQLSRPNENNGSNYVIVRKRDPLSRWRRVDRTRALALRAA